MKKLLDLIFKIKLWFQTKEGVYQIESNIRFLEVFKKDLLGKDTDGLRNEMAATKKKLRETQGSEQNLINKFNNRIMDLERQIVEAEAVKSTYMKAKSQLEDHKNFLNIFGDL